MYKNTDSYKEKNKNNKTTFNNMVYLCDEISKNTTSFKPNKGLSSIILISMIIVRICSEKYRKSICVCSL